MTKNESLNQIEQIVRAATFYGGELARFKVGTDEEYTVQFKHEDDPVTSIDVAVEEGMISLMKSMAGNSVSLTVHGEETGFTEFSASSRGQLLDCNSYDIFIDPLDGTKSFVKGQYNTAISVGVAQKDKLVGGIVYDFMRDIQYGGFGERTWKSVQQSGRSDKLYADLASPHSFQSLLVDERTLAMQQRALDNSIKTTQNSGSIALAMAQTAAGVYNAMYVEDQGKGNNYDVAAGLYLLQATGHTITNAHGEPMDHNSWKGLIAIHPKKTDEKIKKLLQV